MEAGKELVVVVVGGSGYLGLHVLESLAAASGNCTLAYTYHSHPPSRQLLAKLPKVQPFLLDLRTGCGLEDISSSLSTVRTTLTLYLVSLNVRVGLWRAQPDVVINCAAISVPRVCEQNPEAAMAINVPYVIVQWLKSLDAAKPPLLIHLSTDQVYEGMKSFYKEEDETKPVNEYGKSKVAAEKFVQSNYVNFAILRSSIIYGPQPFIPVPKTLPLQWMDNVLSGAEGGEFFDDEFRCPVYVKDVVQAIQLLIAKYTTLERHPMHLLLNLGGPNRVSRADMADTVALVRGYNKALVKRVSSYSVDRGVLSPVDISMDVAKIVAELQLTLTDFATGVALTLNSK